MKSSFLLLLLCMEKNKYIKEAYESNWMSTVGRNVDEAEQIVAENTGSKQTVGFSSGTSALQLCMRLVDIKPDVKVFCSNVTFAARVNPVV